MQIDLAHALVDLWCRRDEPVDHDVPAALRLAGSLEDDPDAPTYLRGFSWNLVDAMVRATGWTLPETDGLPKCRGAAASISHTTALLLHDVTTELNGTDRPVLLLGALGASVSLFGRGDLLPASGALLVRLVGDDEDCTLTPAAPGQRGVRWASAGPLTDLLEFHSRIARIGDTCVRVPSAPLIAARITGPPWTRGDISSFLFCAATHAAAAAGQWPSVRPIARRLGHDAPVREASVRLRLDDWLDVRIPPSAKISARIRRLVRPSLHARIF